MNSPDVIERRYIYALRAIPLIHQGRRLIYIDETSFQARDIPRKSWMPRGRKQIIPETKKEINYTLMGAVDEEGFIGYMIMEKGAQQE